MHYLNCGEVTKSFGLFLKSVVSRTEVDFPSEDIPEVVVKRCILNAQKKISINTCTHHYTECSTRRCPPFK